MASFIFTGKFGGILPRMDTKQLPPTAAQTAKNVNLLSDRLDPIKDLGAAVDTGHTGKQTIFKWYRNSSSSWLSSTGVESYAIGPIKDDDYDRVYYTDNGTLKMKAWNSCVVTRNVGIAPPATPIYIYTNPEDYFRFNPVTAGLSLEVRQTLASTAFSTSQSLTRSAAVWKFVHRPDGKLDVYYKIPRLNFRLSTGLDKANPDFYRTVDYRLNVGSEYIPDTIGENIFGKTISLTEGTTEYGRLQVHGIQEIDMTVTWNVVWTNDPLTGGTATAKEANPYTSNYVVKLTLDMNYTGASGSSSGEQYAHYVCTWVDDLGEESPPGPVSDMVRFFPGQKIRLTLPTGPGGNVATRRIYRSAAGTTEDAFYLVAEVSVGQSTYDDTSADSELEEMMPTFENPPTTLTGIALLPNGYLVGWHGKDLYYSDVWHPYSWPTEYALKTQYDIVGIGVTNNEHVVLTTGNPYIVYGTSPENQRIEELPFPQACASRRSIAAMGDSVLYASPDGICAITHGVGQLVTETFYKPADWYALTPSSAIAAVQDKMYMIWMTGATLIFDMDEGLGAMVTHDVSAVALYTDLVDDTLYVLNSAGQIKAWADGANKTLVWRSKEFPQARNWAPTCGRVVADSYPLTIRLYANGTLVDTTSVASEAAFNFPPLTRTKVWSVEVEQDDGIDEVRAATSKQELGR